MKKRNGIITFWVIVAALMLAALCINFTTLCYGAEATKEMFVTEMILKGALTVVAIFILITIPVTAYKHGFHNGEIEKAQLDELRSFKGNGNSAFVLLLPDYNKKEIIDSIREKIRAISNDLVIKEIDVQYDVPHADMQLKKHFGKENYEQHFSYLISNPCHVFMVNSPNSIEISREISKFVGDHCYNDIYGKRVLPEEGTLERDLPKQTRKGYSDIRCVAYVSTGNEDATRSIKIVEDLLLTRKYK